MKTTEVNGYNYCLNNPLKYIDPQGTRSMTLADMVNEALSRTSRNGVSSFDYENGELTSINTVNSPNDIDISFLQVLYYSFGLLRNNSTKKIYHTKSATDDSSNKSVNLSKHSNVEKFKV
jgi:hypothetical protein